MPRLLLMLAAFLLVGVATFLVLCGVHLSVDPDLNGAVPILIYTSAFLVYWASWHCVNRAWTVGRSRTKKKGILCEG